MVLTDTHRQWYPGAENSALVTTCMKIAVRNESICTVDVEVVAVDAIFTP
jgi:hypothetical protein